MNVILLIDDEPNMRIMWARMLAPLGAELRTAGSVEEAIAQMSRVPPPDLVLLDLKLAPYSAEHSIAAIKQLREFNPKLVVIVISGMSEEEIVETIKGAQVEKWMTKTDSMTQQRLLTVVLSELDRSHGVNDSAALLARIERLMQAT